MYGWRPYILLLIWGKEYEKIPLYCPRGLITAITVIIIYVSYLMPGGRLAAFTAVSFLPLILLKDRAVLASIACYAAVHLANFSNYP